MINLSLSDVLPQLIWNPIWVHGFGLRPEKKQADAVEQRLVHPLPRGRALARSCAPSS